MEQGIGLIKDYFPGLTENQYQKYDRLGALYKHWNDNINVISRKDIDNIYEKHVLHSLGIAKVIQFKPGSKILDVGTGGGFPGIPLAIMFPQAQFHLVDSIGKKIKVVEEVAKGLGLTNVQASHQRAENIKDKYDFVVSRAVTRMKPFCQWVKDKFKKENINDRQNGILYLKGGDLTEELAEIRYPWTEIELNQYFKSEFFETKKVIYVTQF